MSTIVAAETDRLGTGIARRSGHDTGEAAQDAGREELRTDRWRVGGEKNVRALRRCGLRNESPDRKFLRATQPGLGLDSEVGFQCFAWKPDRVRRADVSFIAAERYSLDQLSREGYSTIPPDLAVEVISPNDLAQELDEKLEDYLRAGVKLIWVISPETRTLQVYYPDGTSRRLHEGDEVSGDNVIPGFRCLVAALFPATPQIQPPTTVSPSA